MSRPGRSRYWTQRSNQTIVGLVLAASRDSASAGTILVADDDRALRTFLRDSLERSGFTVLEAGSAAEIFQILETERPDVLLLDIHLGPDDGLAIGAGLRQEAEYSSLKIVFMSGSPNAEEAVRLSRLWSVSILVKPFKFDVLLDAVG